eukprot:scaffold497_cov368-Prasinococcus_capsulatus_cf.AAC.20
MGLKAVVKRPMLLVVRFLGETEPERHPDAPSIRIGDARCPDPWHGRRNRRLSARRSAGASGEPGMPPALPPADCGLATVFRSR